MESDSKILIGAIIIVLIALFIFNISKITGGAVKGATQILVAPKIIAAGETLTITIVPGEEGTYKDIYFYEASSDLRKSKSKGFCQAANKCFDAETFSYKTPSNWESGVYYVKVFDYSKGDFVKAYFTVS